MFYHSHCIQVHIQYSWFHSRSPDILTHMLYAADRIHFHILEDISDTVHLAQVDDTLHCTLHHNILVYILQYRLLFHLQSVCMCCIYTQNYMVIYIQLRSILCNTL